jgi:tRNA-Thr(GGU) m(6)t(6)A37 methyltransferase TsaA
MPDIMIVSARLNGPIRAMSARGRIRFDKRIIQGEHFAELKDFSHVWVLFVFHENTNAGSGEVPSAKIRPPRLYGKKVGCLSTRSPHRPNNIGLSVCAVRSVGADFLELTGIDMVDGTPVLDVKPYIPYDAVPSDLPLPMAVDSKGRPLLSTKLAVPAWIVDADVDMTPVSFAPAALSSLRGIALDRELEHCDSAEEAAELITQVRSDEIVGKKNKIEKVEKRTIMTLLR